MRPLLVVAAMLAAAVGTPVAAAFPGLVFDATCTPREDYVIVDYPGRAVANWCASVQADAGPTTTYPYPTVGVGFAPTCVVTVCMGAFCAPALGCFGGPPRPHASTHQQPLTVYVPKGAQAMGEVTLLCGSGMPCRVVAAAGPGGPTLVLS